MCDKKVFVVAAKRSAIGSMLGSLANTHPADLGGAVVRALLESAKVAPEAVDEVIVGNILPAGNGQGIGRQVAIKGGIPIETPAYAVNMVCGSGMKAVINAVAEIKAGMAPYLIPKNARQGIKMGDFKVTDHMVFDALTDAYSKVHMGITAENIAEKYGISRQAQDEFAYASQTKAIKAVDSGAFKDEIVPVTVKVGKEEKVFDTDEYPNRNTNPEKLAKLRPAFKPDGTVTAGNASGINDSASFTLIASEEAVKKFALTPMAEIIAVGQGGVDPQFMGLGPVPAILQALKNSGLKLSQMEVLELNEAFAAQSLGVIHELSQKCDLKKEEILARCNPNGGAIALGHPVGASGNRIIVTLLHEMIKAGNKLGLASLCIGGGMGTAVILKRD